MIDDVVTPYTYGDDRLEELFLVAAKFVNAEADFVNDYVVDIDSLTLTPDPTNTNTLDDDFLALTCLKAVCLLARAELKKSAGQAIDIKDGPTSVSMKGVPSAKKEVMKGVCDEYERAMFDYRAGDRAVGKIIVGPYRYGLNTYDGRSIIS